MIAFLFMCRTVLPNFGALIIQWHSSPHSGTLTVEAVNSSGHEQTVSVCIIPQKKVKRNYSVISVVVINLQFKCVSSQMMDYVIRNM